MQGFIKKLLRENLNQISDIELVNINDIHNKKVYNKIHNDAKELIKNSGIGLGSNELYDILIVGDKLIGASWLGTSPVFSFDIIIDDDYQKIGLSKKLIKSAFEKYQILKKYRGDNYPIRLNVVNNNIKDFLIKNYDLKPDADNNNILVNS